MTRLGLLISSVMLTLTVRAAFACSCPAPGPPAEELQKSDAVFAGRALSITPGLSGKVVLFSVERSWKGVSTSPVLALFCLRCNRNA